MSRSLPERPNLEFDRKAAKRLLAALLAAAPDAVRRFESHHPGGVPTAPRLADAQLVLAREYGFRSWPAWKAYVETRALDRPAQAAVALRAVCSGDVGRARVLLENDPALARVDFHLACACGEVETVRERLAQDPGAASRAGGALGWTPLEYACFSRWLRADPPRAGRIVEVARRLLEAGADPNAGHDITGMDEPYRETVLFGAAGVANHAGLTRLLLAAGADVNEGHAAPSGDAGSRWTGEALYHASEFPDPECLRLLLEAKPYPGAVSYCFGRALDFERPDAVALYLAHGADPNFRVAWFENRTHFQRAIAGGRSLGILEAMVAAGADVAAEDANGLTAIRIALRSGRPDVAAWLKGLGAAGATAEDEALCRLASAGDPAGFRGVIPPDLLCAAARRNDVPAIERLLAAGAAIDASDSGPHGVSPLHWAAWRGRGDAVRALLAHGADVHAVNAFGGDALGTTIHGSANCFDLEGGPAMRLPEEAVPGDYVRIIDDLIAAGARLPARIWGGSETVRDALRRHGLAEEEGA